MLSTLLHEAAHGPDRRHVPPGPLPQPPLQGATELGLEVAEVATFGWSSTTLTDATRREYRGELARLAGALTLFPPVRDRWPRERSSGKKKVVKAPLRRQPPPGRRLLLVGLFCTLTLSPGARRHYGRHRARGATYDQALRALGNKLVGVLDGCLRTGTLYSEAIAWAGQSEKAAA